METARPNPEPTTQPAPKRLTLEAIYQEKIFEAKALREPHWMQDSRRFSYVDHAPNSEVSTVWIYDIQTGERTPIVPESALRLPKGERPNAVVGADEGEGGEEDADNQDKSDTLTIRGYQWSPDETRLLFSRKPRPHVSPDEALYMVTLATGELKRIARAEAGLRNAKWSPDGGRIGYVRDDDLYVLDLSTGSEVRLTDTAAPAIYNGRFGWVYQEELEIVDGWAWSPDGRQIAYYQVDETLVPVVALPDYDDLHCRPILTRYPKAGDPNPRVRIGIVPVPAAPNAPVPPTLWADLGPDTDIYINRMQWTLQGDLLLHRMARLQNRIDLLKVDAATGRSSVLLTEEDKTWVDVRGNLTFVAGTNQFLWPSDRSGYNHLYLYDGNGNLLRQVTQGDWDVDALIAVDSTHRLAYFTAARPTPMERHLCSVLLDGGGDIIQLTETPGTHVPLVAPDAEHYLDIHSSRSSAPHTRLYRASGHPIAVVHANPMPQLEDHMLGDWEFQTFRTTDDVTLNAALLRPADFDPRKRYPVLMYTYGGPGSQVVLDTYANGSGLEQLLGQKGILFVVVDGRGSGGRGRDFIKTTYLNLGRWETHDQIEGARWLRSLPFVDPARIGIWGWSYGGYVAALCMLRGAHFFKAAAAVAPVTHWSLYDTIYTERYMHRPQDNPKGYAESAPLTYASQLEGSFLLMHGTADDNVHFQNTARLAAELQKHDKTFRMMAYPGKHHGLEGVSTHVYGLLTDFFTQNL